MVSYSIECSVQVDNIIVLILIVVDNGLVLDLIRHY